VAVCQCSLVKEDVVRPLFDTNETAAVLFWTVFVGWAAFEWVPMIRERGRRPAENAVSPERDRSGLVLVGLLYAGLVIGYLAAETVTALALPGPQEFWFGTGVTLILAGLAVRYWAIRTLGRWFTRRLMTAPDQIIVTDGPYRVVRHPSYLGGFISSVGFSLAVSNELAVVAMLACAWAGFSLRIAAEERMLRAQLLPGAYDTYAAQRARMIPHIW
jgi:protein-S-isoprenylcysteine O-methyltransferase